MRFGYVRTNGNGLQEIGHGFSRLILLQVEVRELNEGLRVLYRALSLPGDGVFEGLHGLVAFAQSLERQSHVVFRLNVVWFEFQALLKGFNRLRKLALAILRSPEIIPGLRVAGVPLDRPCQPIVGVDVVFEQDVIESHDLQIKGIGSTRARARGEFHKRFLRFRVAKLRKRAARVAAVIEQTFALLFSCLTPSLPDLPEQDEAQQKMCFRRVRVVLQMPPRCRFRLAQLAYLQELPCWNKGGVWHGSIVRLSCFPG